MNRSEAEFKIGLTLSGGGAKGVAHAGIIKAMEEHSLVPEIISGVSVGAIIGCMYADGKTPEQMCDFLEQTRFFDYVKFNYPKIKVPKLKTLLKQSSRKKNKDQAAGIMQSDRMVKLLKSFINARSFEQLQMPLVINATELNSGRNQYFFEGDDLIEKIVASASVPVFLCPAKIEGKMYVDGGIFNNMPCRVIRKRCAFQVGVHVNPIVDRDDIFSVLDVAERIYNLSIQSSTVAEKQVCDMVLEPRQARQFGIFDIEHSRQIYQIGYDYATEIFNTTKIDLESYNSLPYPDDIDLFV